MTDFTRRTFLSTTAAWGVSWPFVRALDAAWQPPNAQPAPRPMVTFDEPGFPIVDAGPLLDVPGARPAASVSALIEALQPGAILVWRHGSAFPAEAWTPIFTFLGDGGTLLYAGGEPWTRPVTRNGGSLQLEPRTVAYLQALRLNQSYRVDAGNATLRRAGTTITAARSLPGGAWIAALEPRFAETRDFPSESGSAGARDALLRPLIYAHRAGDDSRFPFAAAAYAIDRFRGVFAGGRWVFWLASSPPQDDEWAWLLGEAARTPVDFRVDPAFGCFHGDERPSVVLRAHRPLATGALIASCTIAIEGPGSSGRAQTVELVVGEHGNLSVPLAGVFAPGLHRVTVDGGPLGRATTGFWIFDQALYASGDALTFDGHTLRRNGHPEPIVGTTTMSATVHRDFLFEPNAAVWDDTFAELEVLKLNAIRTGLWSGWRKITTDANVVDEGFLRALEAFYLTARKHGLPVIFNIFAFVPEDFGGADPYFDPRALEGQRAFVSTLARRMAPARELVWDLINEPSFASPENLWSLRPSRSSFERRSFLQWLAARYRPRDAGDNSDAWQDVVRRRWRLRAGESIDLPRDEDFGDAYVMGSRRPYRALDYALFAQDAFERWARDMRTALQEGGSAAAITVGQDEAGLGTSPGPLFHHASVDFTSMHTWWNNDALLWDGVLSKATGTPLLVSETGIMQRQRLSGEAVRTPQEFANLLSRKIGYALAAGAFGVIQWCYETNPFMDSDNEAAIGLKRVDGSVKPEHKVLADAAAFVARNKSRFEGYVPPDVALIVPPEQLSPRSLAASATRATLRAFFEDLRIRVRAVAGYHAARDLGQPAVIVLPACRGVVQWEVIREAVEKGATLICSGWFEADDAELPADRLRAAAPLDVEARPLRMIEPMAALDGGAADVFRFGGTIPESWYATNAPGPGRTRLGAGTIVHHPLPIEWAEPSPALARFYRAAIAGTDVRPMIEVLPPPRRPVFDSRGPDYIDGVLVVTIPFRDAWLVVAVNESQRAERVTIRRPGATSRIEIDVRGARSQMAFVDPQTWRMIDAS